jgi:hypothetical protein
MNIKTAALLVFPSFALDATPCRIEIVDQENGWPVPLVELVTTHERRMVSDNRGVIAVDDPELLGRDVWFTVKGHGYRVPADGFGFEGVRTTLQPGGTFRIEVTRQNMAKRLGRLTGGGQFAESEKLGEPPLQPESSLFGCDSVLLTEHAGKLFWVWGDTKVPGYPLGVFLATAATTSLIPLAQARPPIALRYDYVRDESGTPRGVAAMAGEGPTWLTGLVSFADGQLGATYSKIEGHLEEYRVGLCLWDEAASSFKSTKVLWQKADGKKPLLLKGHPVRWKDPAGKAWLLFGDPFPDARCPDDVDAWRNPDTWEPIEAPTKLRAAGSQAEIQVHRGSIAWNAFRQRWVAVFTQNFGKPSSLGEIWYAEARSPLGPWSDAVKILSHDNYTFYNPRIHRELTSDKDSYLLFEGTYTAEFADHAPPTPRYNYNQILYRLDLDDPRLPSPTSD